MKQQNKLDAVLARVKGNKRAQRIAAALACLVVFVTLWQLTLPAITLEWGKPQAEGITEPEMEETLQEEELLTEETLAEEPEEDAPLLRWTTLEEAAAAGYPDAVRIDRLSCGQEESEGHRHSADCFESYYTAQAASFAEEAVLAMPAQRFEGEAGSLSVRVDAEEGAFPEATEMALTEADTAEVRRAASGLVNGRISQVLAVDIGFLYEGEKIEPEQPVQVVLSGSALEGLENPVVLHIDGEGNAEIVSHRTAEEAAPAPRLRMAAPLARTGATETDIENTEEYTESTEEHMEEVPESAESAEAADEAADIPKGALVFEAKDFSVYAVVTTIETTYITADGETYGIKVTYGEDAGIPEGAALEVRELSEEEYTDYRARTAEALGCQENAIGYLKLLDISIVKDGEPIQPQAKVDVEIRLLDKTQSEEKEETSRVVHFGEEAEELACAEETIEEMPAVTFQTDAFSVYAVTYTVDFSWEVDGKTYEFTLPGGGFVSFKELMTALEIAKDDPETEENELDAFLADVQDVAFSSPELVSVSKAEEDTTVGAIKEALGLACEYSAELTEEDIANINATAVSAGDWALISLKPFDTEESLTVTMADGETFTICVKDERISEYDDVVSGIDYIIYVDQVSNGVHTYYALRNDGASVRIPNNSFDALGAEFNWRYESVWGANHWHGGSNYITPDGNVAVSNDFYSSSLWMTEDSSNGFDIYGYSNGSNHLSWDQTNGFKISNSHDVSIKVYARDPAQYNFTVEVNNEDYGSVTCANLITDTNKRNASDIVATPVDGCYFVGWHLGNEPLDTDTYGATIGAGMLEFPENNMTLTAVFGKNYTSPATKDINEWVDTLTGNPLTADKTAHVYDYDNRIYEIDLSASNSRYTIDPDICIEFITDISRSMYFPSTLLNEQDFTVNGQINLGQWLLNNGDPNEVYYVLADIDNTATMYAVYSSGNQYFTRWSIVDASYYLPYDNASTSGRIKTVCEVSNGRTTINMTDRFDNNANRIFTGKIYNSTPKPPKDTADWDRLSYLTAAVDAASRAIYQLDPGAQIGLVTFASAASGGTLYGAADQESLLNALHAIQPVGGTNQTSAFNLINNSNPPIFKTNSDKRQVALLITDGAPQGTSWDAIERAAGTTESNGAEIWTLGLSLERVGNNKQKLMDLASDGGYAGNAEDPNQLVTEVKSIVQKLLTRATVVGEVYDTVDPAFYPVDADGNPIEAGFYYADTTGGNITKHAAPPSDTKKAYYQWAENDGTWTITYFNQDIKWPQDGGWNASFYIKAKEDFMGGNTISTNVGFDNRVEVNRIKHSGSPDGYYWLKEDHSSFRYDLDTPYVNVDELTLDENSTEWTVYLGTEVDPAAELRALWSKIQINQVIKNNGVEDTNPITAITAGSQMYYSDNKENDAAAPDGSSNEKMPLSSLVNPELINSLIQQLSANGNTTSSSTLTYRYFPYGHSTIGTFEITLEKEVNAAAAEDRAPTEHFTKETGEKKEKYTLTVKYVPTNENAAETYGKTTPGKSAGKVADGYDDTTGKLIQSENIHIINVYAKPVAIKKTDELSNTLTDPATFELYRKSDEGTASLAQYDVSGVFELIDTQTTAGGIATFGADETQASKLLKYVEGCEYYIVETSAPAGYSPSKTAVRLEIAPGPNLYTDLDDEEITEQAFATYTAPYNWTQGVWFTADGSAQPCVFVDGNLNQLVPAHDTPTRTYVLETDEGKFLIEIRNLEKATIEILKQSADNGASAANLPGAVFTLLIKEGETFQKIMSIKESDGVTLKYGDVTGIDSSSQFTTADTASVIGNLPDGEYKLVEESAPSGYIITTKEITFTIEDGLITQSSISPAPAGNTLSFTAGHRVTAEATAAPDQLTIKNTPGTSLPSTGGPGTRAFTLAGLALTLLALAGITEKRKRG